MTKPLFTFENKGLEIRHGLQQREIHNPPMSGSFVATFAAALLLWQPAYGRPAEAQATLCASITIVSMCETAVDKVSRRVRERCNIPYRISTAEIAPRISVGNATGAASGSNILEPSPDAPCNPRSDCIVTVIYY